MEAFNVITDPWIPVIKKDETREVYGVRDVLKNAADIKRIISPGNLPSEEYAIYRFLFALLTDAYEIRSDEDIEEIYRSGEFDLDAFDEYVKRCGNVFNVFDEEHPFMQCGVKKALEYGAKPNSAAVLNWAQLSGNTETFFGLKNYPERKTYEESQYLSVAEYIALIINVTFMQSAITSGFPTAVCDNQPPLWFMFNGVTLFDTLCLNLYPTEDDDEPMWRRTDFLWYPEDEPEGWLSLAFLPSRIVAPCSDGIKDGKIYRLLYNGSFYRGNGPLKKYPEPKSFYDYWKSKEPYIVLRHNNLSKAKNGQRAIEAWKGPDGIAWMQMAEFYGVKLDTVTTVRPKAMQMYESFSDKEKGIIKMLSYKPTQSFYHFELPTQQTKASQEVFRDFAITEDWMYEEDKLKLINRYTSFTRFAMIALRQSLSRLLYPSGDEKNYDAVKEIINGWADRCAQYMYASILPGLQTLKRENMEQYYENTAMTVIEFTKDTITSVIVRDIFTKINESNRLIGILRKELKKEVANEEG